MSAKLSPWEQPFCLSGSYLSISHSFVKIFFKSVVDDKLHQRTPNLYNFNIVCLTKVLVIWGDVCVVPKQWSCLLKTFGGDCFVWYSTIDGTQWLSLFFHLLCSLSHVWTNKSRVFSPVLYPLPPTTCLEIKVSFKDKKEINVVEGGSRLNKLSWLVSHFDIKVKGI